MQAARHGESCQIVIEDQAVIAAPGFADAVTALLQAGDQRLVLDLSRVVLMTSQALGNLILLRNALGKRRMALVLTDVNERNRHLLTITRLDRLLTLG